MKVNLHLTPDAKKFIEEYNLEFIGNNSVVLLPIDELKDTPIRLRTWKTSNGTTVFEHMDKFECNGNEVTLFTHLYSLSKTNSAVEMFKH